MYIELWQGLQDLMHENAGTNEIARAKRFINNTIQDFGNAYDWEFLRGQTCITATANGLYTVQPINQLDASSYVYLQIIEEPIQA